MSTDLVKSVQEGLENMFDEMDELKRDMVNEDEFSLQKSVYSGHAAITTGLAAIGTGLAGVMLELRALRKELKESRHSSKS